jgi:pimeloyl-ACP methyl ester carboxylesterase
VLLHGQPGAASDWAAVIERLRPPLLPLALDRPGYRSSPYPPGDLISNARAVLAELDAAGIGQAVLVGHSYGGGVALTAAALAPDRVTGLVLLASIGPGCLNFWDTLLAAPVAGPVCALAAWWLTPWFARARLALARRIRKRTLDIGELANWDVWAHARHEHGAMWRTFLTEQRALVHDLDALVAGIPHIRAPALIIADPADTMVPIATAHALRDLLPDARLQLIHHGGHQQARRAPQAVADAISAFHGVRG